jgi:hypothetical protein
MGLKSDPTYVPATADATARRDLQQIKDGQKVLDFQNQLPQEPAALSQPTETITGTEGQAEQGGQGEQEEQSSPSMIETERKTSGAVYSDPAKDALDTAFAATDEVAKNTKKIYEEMDPEVQPIFTRLAAAASNVEMFLNKDGDEYKEFSRKISDVKDKMDASNKDLIEFQKTAAVDPDRYYKNTPFLKHAMNSIAMVMESQHAGNMIRAGLPPPTGLVRGRIDKAINDDIARQREAIRSKEAGMTNDVNRYRDNLKLLGDERSAEYKTKLEMVQMVQQTLDATKAKYAGRFNMAAMDKLSADNKLVEAKTKAELDKRHVETVMKPQTGQAITLEQDKDNRGRTFTLFGQPTMALTAEEGAKMREKTQATESILTTLNELRKLRGSANAIDYAGLPTKEKARADMLLKSLHMQLKGAGAWAMGAFDNGTQKFLEDAVPDMTKLGQVSIKYEALEDDFINGYRNSLVQATGGVPFDFEYTRKQMLERASKGMPMREDEMGTPRKPSLPKAKLPASLEGKGQMDLPVRG